MSKNLVIYLNVFDDISKTAQSVESIRRACHRWGANFYEVTNVQYPNAPYPFLWETLAAFEEFNHYDKILNLDHDIIINSNAPNIFEELTDEYDFCAVRDGNPGGRFPHNDGFLRDSIIKTISHDQNCFDLFHSVLKNFNYEKYWQNYFNLGVYLFNPKKYNRLIKEIKQLAFDDKRVYQMFMGQGFPWHALQNFFNAYISSSDLKIKLIDNTWNWIMPDISEEYHDDFYLGKMKPNIYHFCGTPTSKEDLPFYDRWK